MIKISFCCAFRRLECWFAWRSQSHAQFLRAWARITRLMMTKNDLPFRVQNIKYIPFSSRMLKIMDYEQLKRRLGAIVLHFLFSSHPGMLYCSRLYRKTTNPVRHYCCVCSEVQGRTSKRRNTRRWIYITWFVLLGASRCRWAVLIVPFWCENNSNRSEWSIVNGGNPGRFFFIRGLTSLCAQMLLNVECINCMLMIPAENHNYPGIPDLIRVQVALHRPTICTIRDPDDGIVWSHFLLFINDTDWPGNIGDSRSLFLTIDALLNRDWYRYNWSSGWGKRHARIRKRCSIRYSVLLAAFFLPFMGSEWLADGLALICRVICIDANNFVGKMKYCCSISDLTGLHLTISCTTIQSIGWKFT